MSSYLAEQFGFIPIASTGGQNAMKKQENYILRYLHSKFLCNQIIKTIGLILQHNVFGVTTVLFFFCC